MSATACCERVSNRISHVVKPFSHDLRRVPHVLSKRSLLDYCVLESPTDYDTSSRIRKERSSSVLFNQIRDSLIDSHQGAEYAGNGAAFAAVRFRSPGMAVMHSVVRMAFHRQDRDDTITRFYGASLKMHHR